jgi:hypothetical protein
MENHIQSPKWILKYSSGTASDLFYIP